MDGIGLWAPPLLCAALRTLFPNLRPLCSVEELDACSDTLPLLLAGEGICPSGWLLAAFLRERNPYRPVALLEGRCTPLSIWIAWEIGLSGILDLTRTPEEWAETLSHLARGRVAWPSDLVDQAIAFDRAWGRRLSRLSPRDWRRWRDLAAGLPPKALARRWGVSSAGVLAYRNRLMRRLGVCSPEALLALSWGVGIWEGPPEAPHPTPPLWAWWLLRSPPLPPDVENLNTPILKNRTPDA
ncbi:helix-turn-helix transcriptional regulator [Thermoflexus hugenholtzii]